MAAEPRRGPGEAPITSSVQLLVEGNDQRNFFEALAKHLKLPDMQIRNFGGVNELRGFLAAFVNVEHFANVRQIGIVRDAETSAASAFASVQSALANADLPMPSQPATLSVGAPNVGVFILPDNRDSGMLETLLCATFSDTPEDHCIDELFACVGTVAPGGTRGLEKSRCRIWLATKPDPQLSSVGVAAKRGAWDFDHPALEGTRMFLQALCSFGGA